MSDQLGPLTLGLTDPYWLDKFEVSGEGQLVADLTVTVQDTTAATLAAALEALAAACRAGNTYVHSAPGITSPVTYTVTKCTKYAFSAEGSAWLAFWQTVDVTLEVEERPAGTLATLYNAQQTNAPASLALPLLGTQPQAIDLTILDDQATGMHSVHACLALAAMTADQTIAMGDRAHYVVWAKSLTWTTMSNGGADAAMWSNDARYTTSASWQTAPLDTSKYPAGPYKLWARVKQAAGTGYVMDSQLQTPVPVTRTTPHLVEIGDVQLPVQDTAFGTASNLTLYARSDGTNRLDVDAYLLLPLEHGLVMWHPDVPTSEIARLDVGPSGIFMDSACDTTYLRGGILRPKILAAHTGTLVSTAQPVGNTFPSDWGKTDGACTADTNRFKTTGTSKYVWYAATNAATPVVLPGQWYELLVTRDVDSYVAGVATVAIRWQDVDGNTVREDVLSSASANDAAPVPLELYAKAPAHATRALVVLGNGAAGNLTAFWSAVSLRRCPLKVLVVAEDAAEPSPATCTTPT